MEEPDPLSDAETDPPSDAEMPPVAETDPPVVDSPVGASVGGGGVFLSARREGDLERY